MKKVLLKILVLCLCLSTALFAFTACVPDGNNKCAHEWSVDQTKPYEAPTRTTDGKEWYVCSLCGQTKHEKVEKLRYLNGVEKSFTQDFGIVIENFSVVSSNVQYYNNTKAYSSGETITLNFAEMYLTIDENGNFNGYGYVSGSDKYVSNYGDEEEEHINNIKGVAVVEDNVVYVKASVDGEDMFVSISLNDILNNAPMSIIGLGTDTIEKMMGEASNFIEKFAAPTLSGVYEDQARNINTVIKKMVEVLFKKTGDKYSLNMPALKVVNANLYSAKISKVYDELLGKGKFEQTKIAMVNSLDTTFGEMVDYVIANGGMVWEAPEVEEGQEPVEVLTVADMFAELDLVAKAVATEMGLEFTETDANKYFNGDKNIDTFEELLMFLTGEYGLGDIYEFITAEEFRNMSIGEFILIAAPKADGPSQEANPMSETEMKEPETVEELKAMVAMYFDVIGDSNFYDMMFGVGNTDAKQDFKQDIDKILNQIKDAVKVEFTTDKNGVLQGAKATVTNLETESNYPEVGFDEDGDRYESRAVVNLTYKLVKDYKVTKTEEYAAALAEVKAMLGKIEFTEDNMPALDDGYTLTFDEETGKLTSISYYIEEGNEYYHQIEQGSLNVSSSAVLIEKTCRGENIVLINLADPLGYYHYYYDGESYDSIGSNIYILYNIETKEVLEVTRDYINTHVDTQPDFGICDECGEYC